MEKGKFPAEEAVAAAAEVVKGGDLSAMEDVPGRSLGGHRRVQSEGVVLRDDVSVDSDFGVVFDDDDEFFKMLVDLEGVDVGEGSSSSNVVAPVPPSGRHFYTQSFDEVAAAAAVVVAGSGSVGAGGSGSGSVGAGGSVDAGGSGGSVGGGSGRFLGVRHKKAMSVEKLAELAEVDPKKARRICANRKSAARSKERKIQYLADLENKVLSLQAEATSLSAQFATLQRDTNGLTIENNELQLRLKTSEQQANLQDELNASLKEEIVHLKMLVDLAIANGESMMNLQASFPANQPFLPSNQAMHNMLAAQQLQQLHIHSQQQLPQPHQLDQLQQQPQPVQQSGDVDIGPSMPVPQDDASEPTSGASKD